MLRRVLTITLAVSVMVGLLGAFSIAQQKATLTVVGPWTGAEEELFKPVLAEAEEALGIEIEYVVYRTEDLKVLLPTQWAAKTAPGDVIFITDVALVRKGGQEGHIADITELVNPADFVPGSMDPVFPYAAPYTQKPKPGFWYRKSFFAAHGLEEPTTIAEFEVLLEQLKGIADLEAPIASGDEVGWPLSDVTEHFLVTFGGPQLHKELAACTASPRWWSVIEAIFKDFLAPWIAEGYFGEPVEWTTALTKWWEGDYGIYFMGIWLTGMVEDPVDLGLITLPGAMGVVSSIDYLFANAYSAELDKAKELLVWLVTEGQRVQVQQGGHFATYLPVPLELYPPVERTVAEKIKPMVPLADLDDAIGGEFQRTFWDQLKLLWVAPGRVDEVIETIREAWDAACGG